MTAATISGEGAGAGHGLRITPWTVKQAVAFVKQVHRRRPRVQGGMWCVAARRGDCVVGVAVVGWPARTWTTDDVATLCVLRVAVIEGQQNACSMLLAACWRAARAMGCTSMVTYTDIDEPGTSLRAAGWHLDGMTSGGEWSRPARPRKKAVSAAPKLRWWAPGSKILSHAGVR